MIQKDVARPVDHMQHEARCQLCTQLHDTVPQVRIRTYLGLLGKNRNIFYLVWKWVRWPTPPIPTYDFPLMFPSRSAPSKHVGISFEVSRWETVTHKSKRELEVTKLYLSCYLTSCLPHTCNTISLPNITVISDSHVRYSTPLYTCERTLTRATRSSPDVDSHTCDRTKWQPPKQYQHP